MGASSGSSARIGLALDREVVGQGVAGDHHRGGVDAVLATEALEAEGHVDDLFGLGVGVVHRSQVTRGGVAVLVALDLLQAGPERRVPAHDERGHGLGDLVAHDVGLAQHPRGVAHGRSRLDGREGDDLGDPVAPVLLGRVAHHVGAVALVEVHVDVGHLLAARIEEALEQEVVSDWVEVDDAQAVGHAAPGSRTAARADPDARLPGEADEVPHDEEVGREAHVADDVQLELESLDHLAEASGRRSAPWPLRRPGRLR